MTAQLLGTRARAALERGTVIPAHPLALDADGRFDERHQRALTRYYAAAGAGGVAVGVHTTQFAIREAEHNQIEHLLNDFPGLRAIAFNGSTAARIGRGLIGDPPDTVTLIDLPSSSAANTSPFADKAAAWAVLGEFVAP